jgi:protein-L-isoaspartate(D-aspartate) O-methyltransferase
MTLGQHLAEAIARDTGITRRDLLDAFAAVPRERFLGPPPWLIAKAGLDGAGGPAYVESSDLADVYENVSIALDRERQLFNGAPGIVAQWLEALNPRPGERAYHVGCGSGYFTAVLSKLTATVVGVDIDEALTGQAGEALADFANVSILTADGTTFAPAAYDLGLVSTGVSVIPELWLARLNRGGRIVVPLAVPIAPFLSKAIVFLLEQSGAAKMIGGAVIYSAAGTTNVDAQRRLMASFRGGDPHAVQSLRRDAHDETASCWLHERGYCLSKDRLPLQHP